MKSRLNASHYTKDEQDTIRVQVVTVDDKIKAVKLPLDLASHLVREIDESGQVPVLFSNNTYLLVKAFIVGSNDFWKQGRIIVIEGVE